VREPVAPYSHWRRAGDLVVISGQLGLSGEGDTPTLVDGSTADQLRQALVNARLVQRGLERGVRPSVPDALGHRGGPTAAGGPG
jgi:Endoribonuclease L-PSP